MKQTNQQCSYSKARGKRQQSGKGPSRGKGRTAHGKRTGGG